MNNWGNIAASRLQKLAQISESGAGVTRLPFTPEHAEALKQIEIWMRDAGLLTHLDAAGTLVGRTTFPSAKGTFYMGSHQDSVRHGGAYDGIMGVILPILAVQKLKNEGTELPFNVEVLAFADEEGVRFPTALIGSRALAGTFETEDLERIDQNGIALREALQSFGLNPEEIQTIERNSGDALGYLEVHIEQGPILEQQNSPLGVVTAICGIERNSIRIHGKSGHAGTLPMQGRRDALVGASKLISNVFESASKTTDVRATVGAMSVSPNVVNSVPDDVTLTIEIRSPSDTNRKSFSRSLAREAREITDQLGLSLTFENTYEQPAQICDSELSQQLENAVRHQVGDVVQLSSGATHDASAMAALCPISMLFVRCKDGMSHVPEEFVEPADMGAAVTVLSDFLKSYCTT